MTGMGVYGGDIMNPDSIKWKTMIKRKKKLYATLENVKNKFEKDKSFEKKF